MEPYIISAARRSLLLTAFALVFPFLLLSASRLDSRSRTPRIYRSHAYDYLSIPKEILVYSDMIGFMKRLN